MPGWEVGRTQKENWLKFCIIKRSTSYIPHAESRKVYYWEREIKPQVFGILDPSPSWGWTEEPYRNRELTESLHNI